METPTMETAPVESSTATVEQSEVSQSDYVSDAFSEYFNDPREETGEPTGEDPNKEKVVTDKAKEPKTDDNKGKKPNEVTEEANAEQKPDPFETAFVDESGDFDLEKVVGLSLDGLEFKAEEPEEQQEATGKSEIPQWQQEYEQEKTFRETVMKSRLGPLENVFNRVQETELPNERKEMVLDFLREEYANVNQETEQLLQQRDEQNRFKRQQEDRDRLRSEARTEKLPELAKANASAIISKLPGTDAKEKAELYNRIMFGPDAGGELLEDMFTARYSDFDKKPKAEQNKMKLNYVRELQANGGRLQRHFNRAYRYLTADPKNMKRILGQVSRKTDAAARSNTLAAQPSNPAGSVQRQQKAPEMWDDYFSDPRGSKTRI